MNPTPNPQLPPVVFVRGAGAAAEQWQAMLEAIHAHGWHSVRDRMTAWHLARGGVPVLLVDFTDDDQVQVALVRAKYQDTDTGRRMILPVVDGGWHDADRPQQPETATREIAALVADLHQEG